MPNDWTDDDELLAALGAALAEISEVPPGIARAGRGVYAWRTVDAELSALTYDSATQPAGLLRAGGGGRRSLTFSTAALTIEIDVESDPDALRGQLVSDSELPARVVIEAVGAESVNADVDEVGYFAVDPFTPPDSAFRLRCGDVVTPWIR